MLTYAMFPKVAPKFFTTRAEGPKNLGKDAAAPQPAPAAAPARRKAAKARTNGTGTGAHGRSPMTVKLQRQDARGDRSAA